MTEKWLGVTVSGTKVTIVEAEVPDTGPLIIVNDTSLSLQKGDTAEAYSVLHNELSDYARENGINNAIVKGSAVSQQGKPIRAFRQGADPRQVEHRFPPLSASSDVAADDGSATIGSSARVV